MARIERHYPVEPAVLATLRSARTDIVLEEPAGDDRWTMVKGPFTHYDRRLTFSSDKPEGSPGGGTVTEITEFKLAIPLWWVYLILLFRRALADLDRRPRKRFWWPKDVVDADTYNFSTSTTIYDSLGTAQIATSYLRKDAPNLWSSYLFVDGVEVSQPGGDELAFDASGNLVSVNGTPDGRITSATFTPQSGAEDMAVSYDLTTTSQFEGAFGVNSVTQDGFAAGRLDDFDIDTDGMIFARYSNGQAKLMGQVVLSNFPNAPGLKQVGNTAWEQTSASGAPATGAPGSASLGLIQAGALENSNVDITKELVKMIGAQRNFQASAQVISTSDTITQTIINIRR